MKGEKSLLARMVVLTWIIAVSTPAYGDQRVSNSTVNIGSGLGVVETEIIDGSGAGPGGWSSWLINPILNVGYNRGTGTLKVLNAGFVEVTTPPVGWASVRIGGYTDATGTLIVDGQNSYLTATHFLFVGHTGGQGTMEITNGGSVASSVVGSSARVGGAFVDEPTHGDVTISGMNSSWTVGGNLFIGIGPVGVGSVSILNGGSLHNDLGYIGFGTGAIGDVIVSGTDSSWINNDRLVVGGHGHGTLLIDEGGAVTNTDAEIALYSDSTQSYLTVTGADTTWSSSGSAYVGGSASGRGGPGILNIQNGADTTINEVLKVWSPGTVNLTGGILQATTVDHTDGGTFDFTGGNLVFDSFLGDLENWGGLISPGDSTGQSSIAGNYHQHDGGVLRIEVDSAMVFDTLLVTEDVALSGLIQVVFNTVPTEPATYEFLFANTISIGTLSWEVIGLDASLFVPDFGNGRFHVACPADFDLDGDVDQADLADLLAAWFDNPGHPADFDGDGDVDSADLAQLLVTWGPCP